MMLDGPTIDTLADALAAAVVIRLRPLDLPAGWPNGRGHLSEPELAEFLAMSQDFVRGLRRDRKITYTQMGRAIRYSVSDVSEYLGRCRANENGSPR
jgi:excisionase family DNA binding protein